MDEPKRVLIVDDSSLIRHRLSTMIRATPGFEVVGIASTGTECLALLPSLRPDVITLDVQMPDMDGLETLRLIMDQHPTPVLMVSSQTDAGAKTTIDALAIGAIDYIAKPSSPWIQGGESFREDLLTKLTVVAGVSLRPARRRLPGLAALKTELVTAAAAAPAESPIERTQSTVRLEQMPLVVIGSSTGGPQALDQLFSDLPSMLPPRSSSFSTCRRSSRNPWQPVSTGAPRWSVREVDEGDCVKSGTVLVGQGGFHVTLGKDKRYHIDQTPPVHGVRPASRPPTAIRWPRTGLASAWSRS